MKKNCNVLLSACLLWVMSVSLGGCTCGFDCSSDDDASTDPVSMTLLFAGGPVGELREVFIEVDRIDFMDGNTVMASIEEFNITDPEIDDGDLLSLDLLTLNTADGLVIDSDLSFTPDFLTIAIHLTGNNATVLDEDGMSSDIVITDNVIQLDGRTFNSGSQRFVIDFRLARSLLRNASNNQYRIDENEVLLINTATTGTISGNVDPDLFDDPACDDKSDPLEGNRLYLYEGVLAADQLEELQSEGSTTGSPYAVTVPVQNSSGAYEYAFGFVPVDGAYTLAFACDAAEDDPESIDDINVPEPETQLVVITEDNTDFDNNGETLTCDFEPDETCITP